MQFDTVIGNPPYNNDLYIPFVELGHQTAVSYTLMITTAKWQAKGGKKNEDFRANIVPCMREIAYYPNEKDITGPKFIAHSISMKPNTKDKNIIRTKNIILEWLNTSTRYQNIKTQATKNNYYKAILSYIAITINFANKEK